MYPFVIAAAAMALYFTIAALRPPRAARILAGILWGAYAVYEYFVANGTLCDANCNIRVDLVLFLPLLATAAYLGFKTEPRAGAVVVLYVVTLALAAGLAAILGYTTAAMVAAIAALIAAGVGVRWAFRAPSP